MDFLGLDEIPSLRAIVVATVYILFCLLIGVLAKRFCYRSIFGWMVLAFLFSPLVAGVFLFVAGPTVTEWERVKADRARKEEILDHGIDFARAKISCKGCGNAVNIATREGIYSPEDEPWRIICEKCDSPIDTTDVV
jgi:hypothetical protein